MKRFYLLLIAFAITSTLFAQIDKQQPIDRNITRVDAGKSNSLDKKYIPIKVEVYELKNGLTVILNEDHNQPQVFGGVVVRAGGKDDPKDATGMAHYQEHMLFKGTEDLGTTNWEAEKNHIDNIFKLYDELGATKDPVEREKIQKQINEESILANQYAIPNELDKIIKSMGGTGMNAGTGPDITVYYNSFPPNQIEKWLDLYAHRFENPVFRSFQAELEVVYEEKNMYSDIFFFPLLEKFNDNFFKKHPYGQQTLIGSVENLKNPSLTKMYKFFKTWYVPNNMALILVGNFNSNEIKPIIEKKFGKWEYKELPKRQEYIEEEFKGREFKEVKMSPIKLAALGFRTPKAGDKEEIVIEICNALLANENQTGYLDKLTLDNKIMAALPVYMPYNDYGQSIFLIIPKLVGQKLQDAENLVKHEINRLRNGDINEKQLESVKLELYRNFMLEMESNEYKGNMFASAFGRYQKIEDMLMYPQIVMSITKEDVIAVANKYYGDNYLAFYSKMGFPKKEKIEKPGFKPIVKNTDAESKYAKYLSEIPEQKTENQYIDFNTDVQTFDINETSKLYYVNNPANDIFTLKIKYHVGENQIPVLKYASQIMEFANPKGKSLDSFKMDLAVTGCTISFSSDLSYTTIEISGVENNLKQAFSLLSELMKDPIVEQSKIKILYEAEKTNRKMERSEPDNIASALFDYVRYGEKSDYINRLSLKEINKLNAQELANEFKNTSNYVAEVHFVGKTNPKEILQLFNENIKVNGNQSDETPVVRNINQYSENTVFFVNKNKATQSKIYFLVNGFNYSPKEQAAIDAFNLYFGGDFSGLVLQEIREYRSMAYSAGARFVSPALINKEAYFIGFIGTQADKTIEAVEVFNDLVRNMPAKKERIEMIKSYLTQSSVAEKPHFRDLSENVVRWRYMGYVVDPALFKKENYEKLDFNDIQYFYENHLAKKPMVICIVGDKKKIDMKELSKYGKIVEIKEASLFGK